MLTVDANIFVSYTVQTDPFYAESQRCLNEIARQGEGVICPTLVLPESAAAIVRPTGNTALAQAVVQTIRAFPNLTLAPLTTARALRSVRTTVSLRLRGADAVYAALSVEFGTTLITWDQEMLTRAASAVTILTPTDWLAQRRTT